MTKSASYVGTRWANARRLDLKEADVIDSMLGRVRLSDGKRKWWISVDTLLSNYDRVPTDAEYDETDGHA